MKSVNTSQHETLRSEYNNILKFMNLNKRLLSITTNCFTSPERTLSIMNGNQMNEVNLKLIVNPRNLFSLLLLGNLDYYYDFSLAFCRKHENIGNTEKYFMSDCLSISPLFEKPIKEFIKTTLKIPKQSKINVNFKDIDKSTFNPATDALYDIDSVSVILRNLAAYDEGRLKNSKIEINFRCKTEIENMLLERVKVKSHDTCNKNDQTTNCTVNQEALQIYVPLEPKSDCSRRLLAFLMTGNLMHLIFSEKSSNTCKEKFYSETHKKRRKSNKDHNTCNTSKQDFSNYKIIDRTEITKHVSNSHPSLQIKYSPDNICLRTNEKVDEVYICQKNEKRSYNHIFPVIIKNLNYTSSKKVEYTILNTDELSLQHYFRHLEASLNKKVYRVSPEGIKLLLRTSVFNQRINPRITTYSHYNETFKSLLGIDHDRRQKLIESTFAICEGYLIFILESSQSKISPFGLIYKLLMFKRNDRKKLCIDGKHKYGFELINEFDLNDLDSKLIKRNYKRYGDDLKRNIPQALTCLRKYNYFNISIEYLEVFFSGFSEELLKTLYLTIEVPCDDIVD